MRGRVMMVSRLLTVLLTVILLLTGAVVFFAEPMSVMAVGPVQVSLEAPDEVLPGSDFTVKVIISEVSGFDAATFHLHYDSAVLRIDGVDPGKIGSTLIPLESFNDKLPGRYIVVDNIPGTPGPGTNGSGYLNIFHFHVVGSGGQTCTLSFSDGSLSHYMAQTIPSVWSGKTIKIASPPASSSLSSSPPPSPQLPPSSGESQVPSVAPPVPARPPPPKPGTTNISDFVSKEGRFEKDVAIESVDKVARIAIRQNTVGLTRDKEPLSQISVSKVAEPPKPSGGYGVVSGVFDMGPDGAIFVPHITITFTYANGDVPQNVDEKVLVLAYWDKEAKKYIVLDNSRVDTEKNTVTADVDHFTVFSILAPTSPAPVPPPPKPAVVVQPQLPPSPAPVINMPQPAISSPGKEPVSTTSEEGAVGVNPILVVGGVIVIVAVLLVVFLKRKGRFSS